MAVLFLDASACQFSSAALALVKTPIKFRLAIYVSRKLGAKCNGSVRTLIADFAANSLLRMVIIDIESNTSVGGLTLEILPVCIVLRGTMLLFLVADCYYVDVGFLWEKWKL